MLSKLFFLVLILSLSFPSEMFSQKRKAINRSRITKGDMEKVKKHPVRQLLREDVDYVSVSIHTDTTYVLYTAPESIILDGDRRAGPQQRLVMLVDFQNSGSRPFTKQFIEDMVGRVNQYYYNTSYGNSSLTSVVVDWFRLPIDNTDCTTPYYQWVDANAKAVLGDELYNSFIDKVYVLPSGGCRSLSGTTSTGISSDGSFVITHSLVGYGANFGVWVHEYGHTWFNHSNRLQCPIGLSVCSNGTFISYGDPYDAMGPSHAGPINVGHREFAGWLTAELVTTNSSKILAPLDSWSGLRALRIPRVFTVGTNVVSGNYYVEYRPQYGLMVRLMGDHTYFKQVALESMWGTLILDMTPSMWGDNWLPLGSSFYDSTLQMSLTFESVRPEGAIVNLTFGEGPPPIPVSFNCVNYTCVDPGTGTGTYRTLAECQAVCQPPPPDTEGPTITYVSPSEGSILPSKGKVTIEARASDSGSGVSQIRIWFDKEEIERCYSTTCRKNLPVSQISSGYHTITIEAIDIAGNLSRHAVSVYKR